MTEELVNRYRELLRKFNVPLEKLPVGNDGRIELVGRRWILMDVIAFPEMIKAAANVVGERLAKRFFYWFGCGYGRVLAERFLGFGVPRELIPELVAAFGTCVAGWGVIEILEADFEGGRLTVKIANDFEVEAAVKRGVEPSSNFIQGVAACAFAVLINSKVDSAAEVKDGVTVIRVTRR